jgi:hypothetical protein
MYLMYVDESGDCGMPSDGSPTKLFCLSGLVVHSLNWRHTIDELTKFRHGIKHRFKVYLEAELHVAEMINKPSKLHESLRRLKKHDRLAIIRQFADKIATLKDVNLINVVINKHGRVRDKDEVFRWAWCALFQRFENTIRQKNFPASKDPNERGMVFPDNTDGQKLRRLLDEMRRKNVIKVPADGGGYANANHPIQLIIEDPVMRDSRESYLIQAADCAAYLFKQSIEPSAYMKRHGGNAYLQRLSPIFCKHASKKDPSGLGIVRL